MKTIPFLFFLFLLKNGKRIEIKKFSVSVYNYGRNDLSRMFLVENYGSVSNYQKFQKVRFLISK